jgi:hypothetical protein
MSHTKESFRELLATNNRAVERAIVAIWKRQTASEQQSEATLVHNGIGFASCDARMGTYYANWVRQGRSLSGRHLERARKMACKYVGQLIDEAEKQAPARAAALAMRGERAMQQMEAAGDRAATVRDEVAKYHAREGMEVW